MSGARLARVRDMREGRPRMSRAKGPTLINDDARPRRETREPSGCPRRALFRREQNRT